MKIVKSKDLSNIAQLDPLPTNTHMTVEISYMIYQVWLGDGDFWKGILFTFLAILVLGLVFISPWKEDSEL